MKTWPAHSSAASQIANVAAVPSSQRRRFKSSSSCAGAVGRPKEWITSGSPTRSRPRRFVTSVAPLRSPGAQPACPSASAKIGNEQPAGAARDVQRWLAIPLDVPLEVRDLMRPEAVVELRPPLRDQTVVPGLHFAFQLRTHRFDRSSENGSSLGLWPAGSAL